MNFSTAIGMRVSIAAAAAAGLPFPSGLAALKAFAVVTNLEDIRSAHASWRAGGFFAYHLVDHERQRVNWPSARHFAHLICDVVGWTAS